MAKKWPEKVLQRSFIKEHSFRNSLYLMTLPLPQTLCDKYGGINMFKLNRVISLTQEIEIMGATLGNHAHSQFSSNLVDQDEWLLVINTQIKNGSLDSKLSQVVANHLRYKSLIPMPLHFCHSLSWLKQRCMNIRIPIQKSFHSVEKGIFHAITLFQQFDQG